MVNMKKLIYNITYKIQMKKDDLADSSVISFLHDRIILISSRNGEASPDPVPELHGRGRRTNSRGGYLQLIAPARCNRLHSRDILLRTQPRQNDARESSTFNHRFLRHRDRYSGLRNNMD